MRSEAKADHLMPMLNLLSWLHSELGNFVRMTPSSAAKSRLLCPFKVDLPVLREKIAGHRANLIISCPNFKLVRVLTNYQNIHIYVLGIAIIIATELQKYLRQSVRENNCSFSDIGSPFDAFQKADLQEMAFSLYQLRNWLTSRNMPGHPMRMSSECHFPCLIITCITRYLIVRSVSVFGVRKSGENCHFGNNSGHMEMPRKNDTWTNSLVILQSTQTLEFVILGIGFVRSIARKKNSFDKMKAAVSNLT